MGKAKRLPTKKQKLGNNKAASAISTKRIKSSPRPTSKKPHSDAESASDDNDFGQGKAKEHPVTSNTSKNATKKRELSSETAPLPKSFKIVAGTYEKLLYGLDAHLSVSIAPNDSTSPKLEFTLKPIFAFPAHVSCIKAVAASPHGGKWLATGSADEIIKVWDLRKRKEIGGLMHHQGSITHLYFPDRSHLLSASEDGTLCLFHARDWTVLRAMKGHKARVNAVAVHPSGKVALSVGKDRTLRMWDLMRGKGCASTKLGKEGEMVRWSTDGSMFVVQSGSTMDIYGTAMNLLHSITHPSRLHDVKFSPLVSGKGEILLAGAEDKRASVYEVSSDPNIPPRIIAELVGHERRVKALQTITIQLPPSFPTTRRTTIIACTASSDGKIRVFNLASLPEPTAEGMDAETPIQIQPVAEYDTKGTRLTCLALADGDIDVQTDKGAVAAGKRKRVVDDDDDDDVEEDEDEDVDDETGDEVKAKSQDSEDSDGGEEEQQQKGMRSDEADEGETGNEETGDGCE